MTKNGSNILLKMVCSDSLFVEQWSNGMCYVCLNELSELCVEEILFVFENIKLDQINDLNIKLLIELGENTELTIESFKCFLENIVTNNLVQCAVIVKSLGNNLIIRHIARSLEYGDFDFKVFKSKQRALIWLESDN